MSTNKTQNYNLHSWLPQDEFHVAEINENFTALDAALHQEVGVLDTLLQAEVAARTQQMAGKADKTALGQKVELIVGTYAGTGAPMEIALGRRPVAVLLELSSGSRGSGAYVYGGLTVGESKGVTNLVSITATGFSVQHNGVDVSPNKYGNTYYYLAFFQ